MKNILCKDKSKNNGKFRNNITQAVMIAAVVLAVILTCGCTGNTGSSNSPANTAVDQNITVLYSNDAEEQKNAVANLVLMGDESIIPLTKVFSSGNNAASMNAAVALYYIGDSSIEPLINLLNTGTQNEREWAVNTLCLFENRAVPSLIDTIKTGSKTAQESAEIAIIKIGEPAIPFLELEYYSGKDSKYADVMQSLITSIRATDRLQQRLSEEGNNTTATAETA